MKNEIKYGAHVYPLKKHVILVKQTVKRGKNNNDPYVLDDTYKKEKHVHLSDAEAIGRAVQDALAGRLEE